MITSHHLQHAYLMVIKTRELTHFGNPIDWGFAFLSLLFPHILKDITFLTKLMTTPRS